ncbi:MAG: HAD family hydrolase [Terriglobia bacterium]
MAPRAILLDLGNTLLHLDYARVAQAATRLGLRGDARTCVHMDARELRVAGYHGREWLDRELLRRWQQTPPTRVGWVTRADWQRFWRETAAALLANPAQQERAAEFLDHASTTSHYWCVVPAEARTTLAALRRRGLALGVVSNSSGNCRELLAGAGLADSFDVIVDSTRVGVEKPHPEIFRHALAQLGVQADEALMVGDFYSLDVVGAERAGLRALLYDPDGLYWATGAPRITALGEILLHLDAQA